MGMVEDYKFYKIGCPSNDQLVKPTNNGPAILLVELCSSLQTAWCL